MGHTDMPTVDDLKAAARRAFAALSRDNFCVRAISDLAFTQRELKALGASEVYEQEYRRSELLKRGYTPPEDL